MPFCITFLYHEIVFAIDYLSLPTDTPYPNSAKSPFMGSHGKTVANVLDSFIAVAIEAVREDMSPKRLA